MFYHSTSRPRRAVLVAVAGLLLGTVATGVTAGSTSAATATMSAVGFQAPVFTSYDHTTGGGAWNDGSTTYVKGELLGTNYRCGEIATFLLKLSVSASPTKTPEPYTARVVLDYSADSTGQSGVALKALATADHLRINSGVIASPGTGTGTGGSDGGFVPQSLTPPGAISGATVTEVGGSQFTSGAVSRITFDVTGLLKGSTTIVRSDARIYCKAGSTPTGNMQGAVTSVTIVDPAPNEAVAAGNQTVNFRGVGNLGGLTVPELSVVKHVLEGDVSCPAEPTGGSSSLTVTSTPVTVTYCYYVLNSAAAPALNVALSDDMANLSAAQPITLSGLSDQGSGSAVDLIGGGTTYATGRLVTTFTQGGAYTNTATASATNAPGASGKGSATVSVNSGLALVKTVTTGTCPGGSPRLELHASLAPQTVTYCYTVTNYSVAPALGVSLVDDNATPGNAADDQSITLTGLTAIAGEPAVDLAVGASATGSYTTALDASGSYTNVATASYGGDGSATASATVEFVAPIEKLVVEKAQTSTDPTAAGDVIEYSITVTNTGDTTITDVSVADLNATLGACSPAASGVTLDPTEAITCVATHTVTLSDMDSGEVVNTATASGTGIGGPVTGSSLDVVTPLVQHPALGVTKSQTSADPTAAGDVITYDVTVTNTGDVTITDVAVTDLHATVGTCTGATPLRAATRRPLPPTTLLPGMSLVCPVSHVVTQAEVDAGEVRNVATAGGTGPGGSLGPSRSNEVVTPIEASPGLEVSIEQTSADPLVAGNVIDYRVTTRNVGNVTLRNVVPRTTNAVLGTCVPEIPATLAPGESIVCTASHVVTPDDVVAGMVDAQADATGESASGAAVPAVGNLVQTPVPEPQPQPEPQPLPVTGGDPGRLVAWAVELVALGVLVVLIARRRRTA